MSADETIKDRPYPFEVKTRIMQLVGIAIGTPRDLADIQVDFDGRFTQLTVNVQPGGYNGNNPAAFHETIFFYESSTVSKVVADLDALIERIGKATIDGRKIKAQRLRDEAAALIAKAKEIEGVANTEAELAKA